MVFAFGGCATEPENIGQSKGADRSLHKTGAVHNKQASTLVRWSRHLAISRSERPQSLDLLDFCDWHDA
jgi:hypothetical protein